MAISRQAKGLRPLGLTNQPHGNGWYSGAVRREYDYSHFATGGSVMSVGAIAWTCDECLAEWFPGKSGRPTARTERGLAMHASTVCVHHIEDFVNAGFELIVDPPCGHPIDSGIRAYCPHVEEASS